MKSFLKHFFLLILFLNDSRAFQSLAVISRRTNNNNDNLSSTRLYSSYASPHSPTPSQNVMERTILHRRKRHQQCPTTVDNIMNHPQQNIIEIHSLQEYKKHVAEESKQLVFVRFYAPWCRACKQTAPFFYRLSRTHGSNSSKDSNTTTNKLNVKFVQVAIDKHNSNFYRNGLGVPSLPYCHIYHPHCGLIEEIKFTKKYLQKVTNVLESYIEGECKDLQINTNTNMYSDTASSPLLESKDDNIIPDNSNTDSSKSQRRSFKIRNRSDKKTANDNDERRNYLSFWRA